MSDFYGYPTRRLSSDSLELEYLSTAGPRIVRLSYNGSPNLFAEVPEISIPTPYGDYQYLGGHRLWHAPESMPRSYVPDGSGLAMTDVPRGVTLEGPTEHATGIRKRIEIRLDRSHPRVELTHTLVNEGLWEVELAAWALTMFRLGGTAILPSRRGGSLAEDLLPDRHYSLWPYSRLEDQRLFWDNDFILVKAKPGLPPFKIGTLSPLGWSAYWIDGVLFRKSFDANAADLHPDHDCNAEIYCDSHFIELESLGPLVRISPGGAAVLRETWELYDRVEQEFLPAKVIKSLSRTDRH